MTRPANKRIKPEDVAELSAAMHSTLDKPWCLTCSHEHVVGMPAYTWRCDDCGFGSWSTLSAADHSLRCPEHTVSPVQHEMVLRRRPVAPRLVSVPTLTNPQEVIPV